MFMGNFFSLTVFLLSFSLNFPYAPKSVWKRIFRWSLDHSTETPSVPYNVGRFEGHNFSKGKYEDNIDPTTTPVTAKLGTERSRAPFEISSQLTLGFPCNVAAKRNLLVP